MFDFLFDCSVLDIPARTQAINGLLFPVFLFFPIFWMMCQIMQVETRFPNTNILTFGDSVELAFLKPEDKVPDLVGQRPPLSQDKKTELYDVGASIGKAKTLSGCKLHKYCGYCRIQG
jgi:hypothetical protein